MIAPSIGGRADAGEDRDADPVKARDVGNAGDPGSRNHGFDAGKGLFKRGCPLRLVVVGLLAGVELHGVTCFVLCTGILWGSGS